MLIATMVLVSRSDLVSSSNKLLKLPTRGMLTETAFGK